MRRLRIEFKREARADLADIFRVVIGVSQDNSVAEGFIRRIIARCRRIGDAPRGGRPRDDLEAGLRTVPFERSAVIAYRVEADRVTITNVFYGGRDFEALFRSDPPDDAPPA
ncbi:type II toxin-antitoxin system RelE/ParE family toxin [Methylobacterium sp. NEAU 140]|uniref:type II toxin-antitoxin system RelE/ParE family toxin n=1 Tax=Methylobacterium sp. NEAU 140 TaxID=3064945 RepID=UPI00273453D8|nr:type II toxin-antitoxin system RelE/ParE family toxin [Methylobacterium sp. NEAU 140]MDP4024215.1 type II toxin-antitoxin system RelE/ParE family toxin [Methylobacterium sp. NEAU 140]